jgi:futalosine hydrolase
MELPATNEARDSAEILVVAATARELAPANGWRTLQCGVGPVDAAASTAAAIAQRRPAAILHVGIAGARRTRQLAPATLIVGSEARYSDLGVPEQWAPRVIAPSDLLLAAAMTALPTAVSLPIGTTAFVGGSLLREGDAQGHMYVDVEAMEGFAVLRAAQLAGVPSIEVRAISNDIEEADRARWHFEAAFHAITQATPLLVAAMQSALSRTTSPGGGHA